MKLGVHIPTKDQFKSYDTKANDERKDKQKDIASVAAETNPEFNMIGTELTRCGTKNGVTILPQDEYQPSWPSMVSFSESDIQDDSFGMTRNLADLTL